MEVVVWRSRSPGLGNRIVANRLKTEGTVGEELLGVVVEEVDSGSKTRPVVGTNRRIRLEDLARSQPTPQIHLGAVVRSQPMPRIRLEGFVRNRPIRILVGRTVVHPRRKQAKLVELATDESGS